MTRPVQSLVLVLVCSVPANAFDHEWTLDSPISAIEWIETELSANRDVWVSAAFEYYLYDLPPLPEYELLSQILTLERQPEFPLIATYITHTTPLDTVITSELWESPWSFQLTIDPDNLNLDIPVQGPCEPPTGEGWCTIWIGGGLWSNDSLLGDFNGDGSVDAADYTVWRDRMGSLEDYMIWEQEFGTSTSIAGKSSVPEPATYLLALFAIVIVFRWR